MIIPWQSLEEETLMNVIESVVLREGTDYGAVELSLATKKQRLRKMLEREEVVIVWSELHQSLDIKDKNSFLG
ncbi:hypothetical protein A4G20_10910 [Pasteurellaceae bacterium RH1A]|nr:hypothetical protein A4G20_10910 [Pasteurellaceae bacterium RH1A]